MAPVGLGERDRHLAPQRRAAGGGAQRCEGGVGQRAADDARRRIGLRGLRGQDARLLRGDGRHRRRRGVQGHEREHGVDERAEPDAAGGDPLRPRDRLDPNVSRCFSRHVSRFLPMLLPMLLREALKTVADSASWAARARTVTTRCDGRLPCSTAASRATRHCANASSPASTTPGAASLAISSSRRRPNVGWRSRSRTPGSHQVTAYGSSPSKRVDARPHAGQRDRVVAVDRRVGPEAFGPPPRGRASRRRSIAG